MKNKSLLLCFLFCICLAAVQAKASSLCDSSPGNIVANCGFESGDFTSWTLSGNDVPGESGYLYGVEGTDPDTIAPNSGSSQAYFADLVSSATTLSQSLTTGAGQYSVSFYLAQDTAIVSPYSNELIVDFGGATLADLTGIPMEGYTFYSYTGTATSNSTNLSITLGNDVGEFLLDDVDVQPLAAPTPEPSTWSLLLAGGLAVFLFRKRLGQLNAF